MEENKLRLIRRNYSTPGHPTAFAGITKVHDFYNGTYTKAEVKKALQGLDAYTRHREFKQPKPYNPYYTYKRRKMVQADLIDIQQLHESNDGVKYLLLLIDIFTRKVWIYPARSKRAGEMKDLLSSWLEELGEGDKPEGINSDSGAEFKNATIRGLLATKGISQSFAAGTSKAAYAERANKTLQVMIHKYLTDVQSLRYLDVLPDIVLSYNSRPHRSLDNMTPNEADRPENELRVRGILTRNHAARAATANRKVKFEVGDKVRLKYLAKKIGGEARAYNPQFTGEYFEVVDVNTRKMVPMYKVRSMNTGETINERMYANEMQKLDGNVFKVERVLRTRGRRPHRQLLIKWQFFDEQHNSWEPEENIVANYGRGGGIST
jgi:hypothetical protein